MELLLINNGKREITCENIDQSIDEQVFSYLYLTYKSQMKKHRIHYLTRKCNKDKLFKCATLINCHEELSLKCALIGGISTAHTLYNSYYIRDYTDIDLIVKKQDLMCLKDFLLNLKYQVVVENKKHISFVKIDDETKLMIDVEIIECTSIADVSHLIEVNGELLRVAHNWLQAQKTLKKIEADVSDGKGASTRECVDLIMMERKYYDFNLRRFMSTYINNDKLLIELNEILERFNDE